MITKTEMYTDMTEDEVWQDISEYETDEGTGAWAVRQIVAFDVGITPGRGRSQRPPRGVSTGFFVVYERETA